MEHKNIDHEFLETKLVDYEEIANVNDLQVGDHLRITSNVYKQPGKRKCSYIILKEKVTQDNGDVTWLVNSYKPMYNDWAVSFTNPYKQYRAYKKIEKPYNGQCDMCHMCVSAPYTRCYNCLELQKQKNNYSEL